MSPTSQWLGRVVAPPQIGAPLVIGRPGASDFRITSPVTHVAPQDEGMIVRTLGSRYLVGLAGNTYAVAQVRISAALVSHGTTIPSLASTSPRRTAPPANAPVAAPFATRPRFVVAERASVAKRDAAWSGAIAVRRLIVPMIVVAILGFVIGSYILAERPTSPPSSGMTLERQNL